MTAEIKQEIKRTIVIGDIHGCYNEFVDLLKEVEYNLTEDKLILLGDYIDRGKDSYKVIKKIQELQKENNNVIALRGNHEQMLIESFLEQRNCDGARDLAGSTELWYFNGGMETKKSFEREGSNIASEIKWFINLPYYYEDSNRIYVHAGIDLNKPITEQSRQQMLWVRESFIYNTKKYNKQIIFGHTPSISVIEDYMPYKTLGNNICIDTGCVFGGRLTALIIKDNKLDGFIQIEKETEQEIEETENQYGWDLE